MFQRARMIAGGRRDWTADSSQNAIGGDASILHHGYRRPDRSLDSQDVGRQFKGITSFQTGFPPTMSGIGVCRPNRAAKGEKLSGPG